MALPTRESLARQLAETYAGGRVADPWQQVEEYRDYLDYSARNPDAGRVKTGNALDIPPGRIRSWNNGSKPDAMTAIEVAEANGWLDATSDNEVFEALTILVAWVFAGGSVSEETWAPYFTVDDKTKQAGRTVLAAVGCDEPHRNRAATSKRATELKPSTNASVLGRYLTVLGAPRGPKSPEVNLELPDWLLTAPEHLQLAFAQTYVWHRGTTRADRPNAPVQIREERTERYLQQVRRLFDSLVPDATTGNSETFRLRPAAAAALDRPPALCR